MKPKKVRTTPEVASLGDEDLFDEFEAANHHAIAGAKFDLENLAIMFCEGVETNERAFGVVEQMQTAQKGPGRGTRDLLKATFLLL